MHSGIFVQFRAGEWDAAKIGRTFPARPKDARSRRAWASLLRGDEAGLEPGDGDGADELAGGVEEVDLGEALVGVKPGGIE